MTLPEYGLFWLTFLVIFDCLYGRTYRQLMRALLSDAMPEEQRHSVLERISQFLEKLFTFIRR